MSQKGYMYQFAGFKSGDEVRVFQNGNALEGKLGYILEGWDEQDQNYAQVTLHMALGDSTLLESGPDSWESFTFDSIARRIEVSV